MVFGGSAPTAAQSTRIGLGGGLIAPTGDYNGVDKLGWHGLGTLDFPIPRSPASVRVDALFGQTSHKDINGVPVAGHTQLIGGLANVVWHIPVIAPMVKPYVLFGAGVYHLQVTLPSASVDTSETKFTFDFGGGLTLGAGPVRLFVEGRYVSVRESGASTDFLPVTAGVVFGSR